MYLLQLIVIFNVNHITSTCHTHCLYCRTWIIINMTSEVITFVFLQPRTLWASVAEHKGASDPELGINVSVKVQNDHVGTIFEKMNWKNCLTERLGYKLGEWSWKEFGYLPHMEGLIKDAVDFFFMEYEWVFLYPGNFWFSCIDWSSSSF